MEIPRWDLAGSLGDDRLKELSAPPSFEIIADKINTDLKVLCCHLDPCDTDSFERVVYCIQVPPSLFDLFFNSKAGYRASYYRSPYEGLRANDFLIQSLLPALVASPCTAGTRKETKFISESMRSPSAKVWLAEPPLGFCSSCNGEWKDPKDSTADIQNDRWEHGDGIDSWRGRKAPFLTKLRLFGAFVNGRYDEFVPERKRHRAKHIHERGWA